MTTPTSAKTNSLTQLQHLVREAAAYLRDKELSFEAGNLERLAGVEIKRLQEQLEQYRSLVSRAFEYFTDNNMQPPNTELSKWLNDAKQIFLESEREQ